MSFTVTVKLHELVLPNVSDAAQFTVVVPFGKAVPEAGVQVTVRGPSQTSLAVGGVNVATAEHDPVSVFKVMLVGQPVSAGP